MRSLFVALAGLCLVACTSEQSTPDTYPVTISFALVKDGHPVSCGEDLGPLGTDNIHAKLHDARFYVQDVALIDRSGSAVPVVLQPSVWQSAKAKSGQVALIDFESGPKHGCIGTSEVNTTLIGSVPAGSYEGLSFVVGVPETLNHTSVETTPPPLDSAAMSWSWQAGRKFMKVELVPDGGIRKPNGTTASTWFLHLGSTECSGNPATGGDVSCVRPNRISVRFPSFDPATQAVALDLDSLFANNTLSTDLGNAVGCMSGPADGDCALIFPQLGLSLESGLPLHPGQSPAFKVVNKP